MNKRFLSTLLTGAIFLAATSMFVSCKDYDDDIKNLQAQIDKAALKSEVDALQATLSQVSSTASSALSKAEQGLKDAAAAQAAADKAQKAADDAAAQAAKAISDAAKAQNAADAAQAFAETVKTTADAALALGQAAATKDELTQAKKDLTALITDAQSTADAALALAKAAATKAEFDAAVEELTKAAADAQATADEALKIAKAAATKAEFDEAVAKLTKLANDAQAAADAAQASADQVASDLAAAKEELKKFAEDAAKEAKEAALTEAKAYADELAANEAEAVKEELKKYATNTALKTLADEINNELEELKDAIAQTATEAAFEILSDDVKKYAGQIDVLFAAVTSVELFASISYNDWGIDWRNIHSQEEYMAARAANLATYQSSLMGFLDMYDGGPIMTQIFYGSVKENSVFGDEAYQDADKLIEYKKGADIKDEATLLVRVNPVNADLSAADMKLINSKGEDLSDVIVVAGAERFNEYLYAETTRGNDINSGLWKVTLKAADGLTPEAWAKAVTNLTDEQIAALAAGEEPEITSPVGIKKFALAINNTQSDNADRYVASTFDLLPIYAEYMPAPAFTFSVNDIPVNYVRNRWCEGRDNYYIYPEQQRDEYFDNPELAWNRMLWYAEENAIPATEPTAVDADDANVIIDSNVWYTETRRYQQFIYADVNEEFTISNVAGWYYMEGPGQLFSNYYLGQQIDYYYVVFDKDNAIESNPSEWNAWKHYTVEGLGVMTKADQPLTMKITSEDAHGDVVGFRVYAVNRDGTLADPDGRAFYVYVGSKDDEFKTASANIIADKLDAVSEEMDVTGWFKESAYYYFTPDVYSTTPGQYNWSNDNPEWVDYDEDDYLGEFTMRSGVLTFYDADGEELYQTSTSSYGTGVPGFVIADAVKVTFTPKEDVSYMLDGKTYVINIYRTQEEAPSDNVESYFGTLSITKVMPTTAKEVEFRPKQEGDWKDGIWSTKDGTGKFMAYMIPNTNTWSAPWATQFEGSYAVGDEDRDNGFKDLNNIFYNLNEDRDFEFVFATSLSDGDDVVDLTDEDGNGLSYNYPAGLDMNYVLDVATPFIDGKTEHAVTVYTNYKGVSTYIDEDGDVKIGQTWKVAGDQALTAIYACWHHAMYEIGFPTAKQPKLQWVAEPEEDVKAALKDITTKNRYNADYFGLSLDKLIANKWLVYNTEKEPTLTTEKDGAGQVNPYFVPSFDEDKANIIFKQKGTQADANPTADHTEYLNIYLKDAYGHEVIISSSVLIKKAKSNAPAL